MIKLIIAPKGHNKTIKLVEMVNDRAETSKGSVLCIEKVSVTKFLVSSKVRLIDIDEFDINSFDEFYCFICGLIASNYDITDIFVDSTLRICGRDSDNLHDFIQRINSLSIKYDINFVFTISSTVAFVKKETLDITESIVM